MPRDRFASSGFVRSGFSRPGLAGLLAMLALSLSGSPIQGAYITGVTATTSMGSGMSTNIANTTNAVGLATPSLTATHGATIPTNSWVSNAGTLTGTVTFNLNGTFMVDSFAFWNQNGGGPSPNGITGINAVTIEFSGDGGTTWNPVPGAPTNFAQVMCTSSALPQIVSFAAVSATHFRFNITSNHGDTGQTGFAEVAFNNVATGAGPASASPSCGTTPAGVTVTQSGGATAVTEGGATDTYTVVLNSAPTANVTINLTPGTQLTVTPATLTFTPANFGTAQTVTVSAVDDAAVEGAHSGTITHVATSTDTAYNGVPIGIVLVSITDNDSVGPPVTPPPPPPTSGGEGSFLGSGPPLSGGEGSYSFAGMRLTGAGGATLVGPCLPHVCCDPLPLDLPATRPQRSGHANLRVFNVAAYSGPIPQRSRGEVMPAWAEAARVGSGQADAPAGRAGTAVVVGLAGLLGLGLAARRMFAN